jgi:hypothetical protein
MLVTINVFHQQYQSPTVSSESFAIVNGRYYADAQLARTMALEALRNVAVPTSAYFPDENFFDQTDVMREQLRELRTISTIFE